MTDIPVAAPHPTVPVFRTAYDAYRLGIGAFFGNSAMFRFLVYGSALSLTILATEYYLLFWTAMNLHEATGDIAMGFLEDLPTEFETSLGESQ